MTPWGVWKAVAKPWGTEWVTGMNSTSKGPICRRSPSCTGYQLGAAQQARFLDPAAGQAQSDSAEP